MDMLIVDAHCHVSLQWYEPVEALLFQMDRFRVDKGVLVQIFGEFDNGYQNHCVRTYPDRLSSVVLVDWTKPEAHDHLERLKEGGAKGLRLRPDSRSPGDNPYAIWERAQELDLPISCGGTYRAFASEEFSAVLARISKVPVILEHMGSENIPDDKKDSMEIWNEIAPLARFPNVYIKIHGLGEFCKRTKNLNGTGPFTEPVQPVLEAAFERFGPERMMWGSDFPPVSNREGYGNALNLSRERLSDRSEEALALVFGGTAGRVYNL